MDALKRSGTSVCVCVCVKLHASRCHGSCVPSPLQQHRPQVVANAGEIGRRAHTHTHTHTQGGAAEAFLVVCTNACFLNTCTDFPFCSPPWCGSVVVARKLKQSMQVIIPRGAGRRMESRRCKAVQLGICSITLH